MTSWNRLIIYSLLVFFVLLIFQDALVNAKRSGNKVEKVKDRQQRDEKRHLKREGKKIKKSFSKKYEQLYFSLCPDCYTKLLKASDTCSQNYEKLNLPKDKIEKCKERVAERTLKKKKKHLDNSIEESTNLKGWKDVYERETKILDCLFDNLREDEKYRSMNRDEFRKEKHSLTSTLMQEKTDCIKKMLQTSNGSPESSTTASRAK